MTYYIEVAFCHKVAPLAICFWKYKKSHITKLGFSRSYILHPIYRPIYPFDGRHMSLQGTSSLTGNSMNSEGDIFFSNESMMHSICCMMPSSGSVFLLRAAIDQGTAACFQTAVHFFGERHDTIWKRHNAFKGWQYTLLGRLDTWWCRRFDRRV